MDERRRFLKLGLAGSMASLLPWGCHAAEGSETEIISGKGPLVLSTWRHGVPANARAWEVLQSNGSVLDAVEQGVSVVESDFTNRSVGLGGWPDRNGVVTLDACIQDHDGRAGAVAFVRHFQHPINIARAVMERTPHVMLVGAGAENWALENGFIRTEVDIPETRKAWKEWLRTSDHRPEMNIENRAMEDSVPRSRGGIQDHDTIGMIAMDADGRLAGSCTTSGLAWKIHGRVGDSPIIGAGLFVDGDVGAACATGVGELVIRTVGSHTVVELMRQGMKPEMACREAVLRILRKHPDLHEMQVGFLAIRADGLHGAWSTYKGFECAVHDGAGNRLENVGHERI